MSMVVKKKRTERTSECERMVDLNHLKIALPLEENNIFTVLVYYVGMMMSQYKLSQNSMHSSPASSNYQQTTISHSPSR